MEFILEEVLVKDEPETQDKGDQSVPPQWKINSNPESTEILSLKKEFQTNIKAETTRIYGNLTSFEPAICTSVHHVDLDLSDMFLIEKTIKVEPNDAVGNSDDPLRLYDLNDEPAVETANKSMMREASKNAKERKPRKEVRLKCETCGKIFLNAQDLSGHKLTHTGIEPFKCEKCGMTCFGSDYFVKHMKTHFKENDNSEKLFQCDVRKRTFKTSKGLTNHKSTHTADNLRYKCKTCEMPFPLLSLLTKHRLTHGEDKPYKCHICGETFQIETELIPHMRFHTSKKPVRSGDSETGGSHCQISTELKTEPMKIQKSKKSYKCEICEKIFGCFSILKRHELSHVKKDKRHKCETCGKSFAKLSYLTKHRERHRSDKRYKCDVCEKSFTTPSLLKRHVVCHSETKSFLCDQCGKGFASQNYLNVHCMCIHTGLKPHKCNVCEKTFRCSSNLKQHKMSHDVNRCKPHKCETCGKCFAHPWMVKKHDSNTHVARHKDLGPRKSNVCENKLSTNPKLDRHQTCHTGEKPFECVICGKCFNSNNNLKAHRLSHTKEKKFKCDICETRFTNNSHLKRHAKNLHKTY